MQLQAQGVGIPVSMAGGLAGLPPGLLQGSAPPGLPPGIPTSSASLLGLPPTSAAAAAVAHLNALRASQAAAVGAGMMHGGAAGAIAEMEKREQEQKALGKKNLV